MSFQLSIAPVRPSDIPSEEVILERGREVLEQSKTWKQGKSYANNTVKTYSKPKASGEKAGWYCRVSEHAPEECTFEEFWSKLGENKAENEQQYIDNIKKVAEVKHISPTQSIWTLYYTFPPPVSPRVFTVLQTKHLLESSPRRGMIVSIPIDLSGPGDEDLAKKEEKGVKGRYVSVEQVLELENGKVEWRMATSSTPGGSIPSFVAEGSMASQISADVPHFLKWFHTVRSTAPKNSETPAA